MTKEVINIPVKVIDEILNNGSLSRKEKMESLELVAFSAVIKLNSECSVIKNCTVRTVMSLMRCGQARARRIIENSRHSDMFAWFRGNICAKRILTKKYSKVVCRDGKTRYNKSQRVMKIHSGGLSAKSVMEQMFSLRCVDIVRGTCESFKHQLGSVGLSHVSLTLSRFARLFGCSVSTICRRFRNLVNQGLLDKRPGGLVEFSTESELASYMQMHRLNHSFRFEDSYYAIRPNQYKPGNMDCCRRVINLIFNHDKRIYPNTSSKRDIRGLMNGEAEAIARCAENHMSYHC